MLFILDICGKAYEPTQVSSDQWDCSHPSEIFNADMSEDRNLSAGTLSVIQEWRILMQHVKCNLKKECTEGQDEDQCSSHKLCGDKKQGLKVISFDFLVDNC